MPDITGALTRSTFDVIQLRGEYMVVGAETIYVYTRDHNGYVLSAAGLTVPTTATAGYAKGATFIKTDAADGTQGLYQNKGTTTSCTFELIQPGGGGGVGSLDDAYSNGSTITMDAGPVALNDATAGTSQMLVLTKTAAGSGNMLDINCTTAASTGNLVDLTTGTNLAGNALAVTTAGVRTAPVMYINGAATDAGSDDHVLFIAQSGLLDSNLIQLTYSVANSTGDALGITMATALAGRAISISGTGNRTGDLIDISSDDTGSGHVMDINMSGAASGNVLDITYSAAANTGHAISVTTGTNLAGNALLVTTAGARTAPVINVVGAGTDAGTNDHIILITQSGVLDSNMIQLTYDTAASTGDAIGIAMGTNLAGSALSITSTGGRTDDLIKIDDDSTGNSQIFDINISGIYTGNVIDITYSVAAVTGHMLNLALGTGVAASAMVITATGVRTNDLVQIDTDDTGNSHVFDINVTGANSGNVLDITYSAASTGEAIKVVMADNVAGSALVITGTGTRTDDFIKIDSDDTGAAHVFDINLSGAGSGNCLDIAYSAAAHTGDAISVAMGTAVAGSALVISATGSRTDDLIKIDDDSTGNSPVFDINMSGIYTGNIIDITYSVAAVAGDMLSLALGTGVAASAMVITATGVRTDDLIKVDSDDTGNSHVFDINLTGAASGNGLDITYSVGANTGNAISLAMGTNVGGQAITVSSAATGVANEGSALQVAHTGNLVANANLVQIISTGNHDASSDVVYLEQSTGAGTAGTTLLRLNATGANVEALAINAGLAFLSAETAAPGSGDDETLPITSNVVFYDPNGASRAGIILSAGLREGQTITVVNIADAAETITFAAAAVSNVAGGASVSIARFECLTLVWNVATTKWYCMGAGL